MPTDGVHKTWNGTVTLAAGDLEVGAVEVKNATTDDRAAVKTASTMADTDKALAVADPNVDAKLPALGAAAAAASAPVTLATDDTHMGAVGAAADVDGTIHGQLRYIGDNMAGGTELTSLDDKEVELDLSAAPVQVSLSTSTARSTQLAVGRYVVKSNAPVFVRQGSVTIDATVTTDFKLEAGVAYVLNVTNTTTLGYLAGILSTGTGTLDIQATL